ncbi:MAG: hypothetical protein ACKPKO_53305, partial [Candidatus Fonsibacter sp.]
FCVRTNSDQLAIMIVPKKGAETKCDGHKVESPKGNKKTCQYMIPKDTPQYKEPKHKDDGHKEESPKGNNETC